VLTALRAKDRTQKALMQSLKGGQVAGDNDQLQAHAINDAMQIFLR
jgi:hypothetical protein